MKVKTQNPAGVGRQGSDTEKPIPSSEYTPSPELASMAAQFVAAVVAELQAQEGQDKPAAAETLGDDGYYLTADEVGMRLSISGALVQAWGREGQIRRYILGERYTRFLWAEVLQDLGLIGRS